MIYFLLLIFDYDTDKVFMPGSPSVYGRRVSFHAGEIIEAPAGFAVSMTEEGLVKQRGKDCLLNTRGRRDLARGNP